MKPKAATPQSELFGARLSELLNPEHPLYVLAERLDWSQFDAAIDTCYADELGRPGVNTRLMVGLVYLKHVFDESDESVVARWVENPYWQFLVVVTLTFTLLEIWRQRTDDSATVQASAK
jgi:IS5 family transposase